MLYNDCVTGTVMVAFAMIYPEEFDINRPFVYSIVNKFEGREAGVREKISLFAGQITNPEY